MQIEEFIILIPDIALRNKITGTVFVQHTNFAALQQCMELANELVRRLVLDDALCLSFCQFVENTLEPILELQNLCVIQIQFRLQEFQQLFHAHL